MVREYSTRRSSRSRMSAPHQVLVITIAFVLGYLTASFSLFDIQKISQWVNTQILAHHELKKEVKPEVQQAAIPSKPKFEFYTLLANEKVPNSQSTIKPTTAVPPATDAMNTPPTVKVSSASAANTAPMTPTTTVKTNTLNAPQKPNHADKNPQTRSPVATVAPRKENFLVQVASFKARQDAEHMKGKLILKGFNVYIIPVNHATKGNWFRVVVGPYSNRVLAQKAQISLARNERLNGMITTGG